MIRFILKVLIGLLIVLLFSSCKGPVQTDEALVSGTRSDTAVSVNIQTTPNDGFNCTAVNEIPVAECQALVAFFEAIDGPNWENNGDWLQTISPCTWLGVTCANGHVDTLGLFFNNLEGQIPDSLADLSHLRVLDLHNNAITGPIPPELGRLPKLEYIDFSVNQLTGSIPAAIGDLVALQSLALQYNNLGGVIPVELGQTAVLRNIDLSYNQLNGEIPTTLADLTALESIRLRDNQLEGEIPFGIGELTSLSEIDLTFNQLTGTAPSALFQIPIHRLWGNQLEGTIFLEENGQQTVNYLGAEFTFDQKVANSVRPELVPARQAAPGPGMMWAPPEHIEFTLVGTEPLNHAPLGQYLPAEAQLHVYPTASLNEEVQPIVADLQQILTNQASIEPYAVDNPQEAAGQTGLTMLPPSNALQMLRAQAQVIPFVEGSGVRFINQLSQGPGLVNNQDLFYTFQGLTDDGATYVAAYFPISLPALPDTPQISDDDFMELMEDWQGYVTHTFETLNGQSTDAFTPDLADLDALINSLSVAGTTAVPTIQGVWPSDSEAVDNQPVLQWASVPDAANYHVIVLDDAAYPPKVVIDQVVTDPLLPVRPHWSQVITVGQCLLKMAERPFSLS